MTDTAIARRLTALTATGLCLIGLTACSTPAADQPAASGGDDATTGASSGDAAREFTACLTGKGLDARLYASTLDASGNGVEDAVELRMLDASGNPVAVGGDSDGASISSDSATSFDDLYPGAAYTVVTDDGAWVTFPNAQALAGSPYAASQQDYATCEAQVPAFSQPVQDAAGQQTWSDDDKRAALDFARQARDRGFSWVQDPTADAPTTIMIPDTVGEGELRRFLEACPMDDLNANVTLGFAGTPDEFGYDYTKVMDETSGAASTSSPATTEN
ncbi:hypothetical protein [Bifidobacterium samirii]|uniref:Uridine kinase n=1 Tax=Bifidobacterium samirii TaxID=2306974 RepID=A0A430FTP6_9BIFI|nr:hypothetical protein [Bifidobacterium samirii]RSX56273.1 uridine kinase [Bifidobacterium samirii]